MKEDEVWAFILAYAPQCPAPIYMVLSASFLALCSFHSLSQPQFLPGLAGWGTEHPLTGALMPEIRSEEVGEL